MKRPFHEFLRSELALRKISGRKFARKVGLNNATTVQNWLKGALPKLEQFPAIAAALDMDVVALLASIEIPSRELKQEAGEGDAGEG